VDPVKARARDRRATLFAVLRVIVLSYLGLCLMLLALQRHLIYYPTRAPEEALVRLAESDSLAAWRDGSGGLQGWRTRQTTKGLTRRMILFHGNAGHALQRAYFADLLRASGGGAAWDVYLFEYPGFGARPGAPNEQDIVQQAVAAVDALWEQDPRPVFLTGESLGSAVACAVAKRRPQKIAGLLLMTPFNNLTDVAKHHYPFFPVRWLLRERYASDAHLQGYPGPVAFVLAADDEVVPLPLGQKLYEGYAGRKRRWVLPRVGHNNIAYDANAGWWQEAIRFLLSGADISLES
jgi:pimeloyl-ACP methyl ester carboxylesterase